MISQADLDARKRNGARVLVKKEGISDKPHEMEVTVTLPELAESVVSLTALVERVIQAEDREVVKILPQIDNRKPVPFEARIQRDELGKMATVKFFPIEE
jgi:hypothetical protein